MGTGNGQAVHWLAPQPVVALIAGRRIDLRPCFGNIDVPVLGREDFFSEFYVEVDEANRFVKITPMSTKTSGASHFRAV
ncbi:MAG: hypothetical protein JSU06_04790 [Actinobacteria bacterium]|nr:hypothetical protein [Actinomycetota bacterium]